MIFEFLDLKPRNPYLSLAIDEAIALFYGKVRTQDFHGGIRLWANPPSIVLGRTCKVDKNIIPELVESFRPEMKRSAANSRPFICRRASGGGTVLHGPGNINYSIFLSLDKLPRLFDVKNSYITILGMIQRALEAQGINCEARGQSDLAVPDATGHLKKISGNAQFRKYGILMHHGTLITRKHLVESIDRFLMHPPREPDYRKGRSHSDFLGSVPDTFDFTAFYNFIAGEMRSLAGEGAVVPFPSQDRYMILRIARQLVRETYGSEKWILDGQVDHTSDGSIRDLANLESMLISRYGRRPMVNLSPGK